MPNVFLGVFFHWLGGLASGSFYVPYRFVRKWSWEVYWLAGGFVSWIIAPWLLALLLTKSLLPTIAASWAMEPQAVIWSFLFGMMWGVGGLTFGLTMRYLGMSLGMAVALGYCTVLGSLMPPVFQGTFTTQILGTQAGLINLFGLGICALGIALAGTAGMSKEREMSEDAKRESIKEFSFTKGIIVATISGVFSAGMAYGMAAAEPLSYVSKYFGTGDIWSGLPKLCVILLGGFTTNFIWCMILLLKNGTLYQFFSRDVRERDAQGHEGTPVAVNMFWNYFFSALAGLTWYMQFFFYSMGETQMGDFKFSSWTLHMASIIIFSSLWGIALKEWAGTSRLTKTLLALGIGTLLYSTFVVGYSNYMNADKATVQTQVVTAGATIATDDYLKKDLAPTAKDGKPSDTGQSRKTTAGFQITARPLDALQLTFEEQKIKSDAVSKKDQDDRQARWLKQLQEKYPVAKSADANKKD
ncbi:MAG: L-rhamnose/proton symporter RhaT [Thermoguttaceae bacterium]|nr:L-rhamnose/proton symporter RhaT [Thermoguttaceae bacterium]